MAKFTVADLEIERNDDVFEMEMPDGKTYRMPHPQALNIKDILEFEQLPAAQQIEGLLGDDFDDFAANEIADGFFFDALMKKYTAHYGLGSPPESRASRRSSSAMARRSR